MEKIRREKMQRQYQRNYWCMKKINGADGKFEIYGEIKCQMQNVNCK